MLKRASRAVRGALETEMVGVQPFLEWTLGSLGTNNGCDARILRWLWLVGAFYCLSVSCITEKTHQITRKGAL